MPALLKGSSNTGNCSHTVILDSLVQSEKYRDFGKGTTVQDTIKRLQKRAGRKYFSIPVHIRLAELCNDREQYYRNCIYCASTLIQEADGRIRTSYCNGRLCPICQAIRTAKAMNKYVPLIETFNDPHFLTLTRTTVQARALPDTVERMCNEFSLSNRTLAKRGIKVHGLRKLEITCNHETGKFHPHFHCIVEGEEVANALLDQWLKRNATTAQRVGQELQRIIAGDPEALRTMFGYVTKLVTPYESGKIPVPAECLDIIVSALFKRRTLQPYGILFGGGNNTEQPIEPEPIAYVSPINSEIHERIFWDWEQDARTWVDRETGEQLFDT